MGGSFAFRAEGKGESPCWTVFRRREILELGPRLTGTRAASPPPSHRLIASSALPAAEEAARRSVPLDAGTAAAVDRGLAYLIRTQEASGVVEGECIGRKVHVRYVGHEGPTSA